MFSAYLEPFADCEPLQRRILAVLNALPDPVIRDFVDDHRFRVAMDEVVPGKGRTVRLASPGPVGESSRCVVLKRRLADRSEAFACYVIAHEFAHAYLRNGGWGDITDPEHAADALAASWGFRLPAESGVAV
jgi:hypothetical protein